MTDCRLKMSKKWQYPAPWSMNQVRNLHNASRHFACTRVNGTHSSSFLSCFVHFHKAHVTDQMWFKVFGITIGQYETWKEEQGKLIRVYTHDWFHVIPFDQSAFSRPGNLAAYLSWKDVCYDCPYTRTLTIKDPTLIKRGALRSRLDGFKGDDRDQMDFEEGDGPSMPPARIGRLTRRSTGTILSTLRRTSVSLFSQQLGKHFSWDMPCVISCNIYEWPC